MLPFRVSLPPHPQHAVVTAQPPECSTCAAARACMHASMVTLSMPLWGGGRGLVWTTSALSLELSVKV